MLYKCNYKCKICNFWKEKKHLESPTLSVNQVRIIAEKIKPLGPQVISIGGGEPLLHKNIIEITKILAKNNFPVMICNGWYIDKNLASELFKAGMYEISISLDYASKEKHDKNRGINGAYEKALSALKILHENRIYPHQRVHMISVVMDDNIEDIEKLILLSKRLGISYLITLYSDSRGRKENKYPKNDISKHLLGLKNKYREFVAIKGYLERFSEAAKNHNSILPCYAGVNLFNIDSSGDVTRCIDCLDVSAGNIFRDDITLIEKKLHTQFENDKCGGCWTSCRGNIETLMYGKRRLLDLFDSRKLTKSIPIGKFY